MNRISNYVDSSSPLVPTKHHKVQLNSTEVEYLQYDNYIGDIKQKYLRIL